MKNVIVAGCTGSVGTGALEAIEALDGELNVLGLSGGENIDLLKKYAKKFSPRYLCVKKEEDALKLSETFPGKEIFFGSEGLEKICSVKEADVVLVAVSGKVGLKPVMSAINAGKNVALANKETLVTAGDIVMNFAKEKNVKILPVDSEHSAIFQCTDGHEKFIDSLIITASGGPFLRTPKSEMKGASVKEALAHPRWSMGKKITVDSATLMNKGFEVIEAHYLFGIDYDKIKVVIHPQSVVHSAAEFVDGSVIAQIGNPSMHLPVQYALCYPERKKGIESNSFDFVKTANMTFEEPDYEKFPLLKLAIECGKSGGTYPACLNAADEEAVFAFLDGKISFDKIEKIVFEVVENHNSTSNPGLDDIIECGQKTSTLTKELIKRKYEG